MPEFKPSSLTDAQIEQLQQLEQRLERETNESVVLVAYSKEDDARDAK